MLRNYLKITFRHLWRSRLFTLLNVVGLAIGLSASWIIYRLVSYEFAFDQQHPNKERTFRVVSRLKIDGREQGNPGIPSPMIQLASTAIPGIERAVPVFNQWTQNVYVPLSTGKPKRFRDPDGIIATDAGYFSLFPVNWLAGSPTKALSRPNEVVLTQSRASQYFPELQPAQVVGLSLTYFDTLAVTITGIVADPVLPTSFDAKELLSISTLRQKEENDAWGGVNSGTQLLIRLSPKADPGQVGKQLNAVSTQKGAPIFKHYNMAAGDRWHVLQPLADVHFGTDYPGRNRTVNRTVLYGLMGLAGFILLLAIINYINLTSAQVPGRAREIGIRKTLGSRSRTLIGQFLLETLFVTLLALVVAFGLSQAFAGSYGDLLPKGSDAYINWPQVVGFLLALVLVVSVVSGWYPGWLITRFQPAVVLRGQTQLNAAPRVTLRKSLIVFQFLIAQVFIIGTLIVGQQLRYLLQHDMGFDREAVVTIPLPFRGWDNPKDGPDKEAFRSQLAGVPGIAAISLGNPPANNSWSSNTCDYQGKKGKVSLNVYRKYIDTAYIGLYRLSLLAGRNLRVSDTVREFIINETTLKAMGLTRPQDAIGQVITENNGSAAANKTTPIVGVVRDFHIQSFHQKVPAVALMMDKSSLNTVNIRLASHNSADWPATLSQVAQRWKTVYADEPFTYEFYDQTIAQFYEQERTASRIINLATAVAILISCLGLFGLAALTAFQRMKEIGIRKVFGASVGNIVTLLSRDFLKLVLIAILIASPIAWWAMNHWLRDFAYKIDIAWWVFALAGLLAVVIALLTVSFQSIKAALMNPVRSLRSE